MTHSVIQIGDGHFGPRGGRNEDRYAALEQIVSYGIGLADEGRLAAWVWPGDLGDARLPIPDVNRLDAYIQRMADFAPVIICYGNHDLPGDLDSFARIGARHEIQVVNQPKLVEVEFASGAYGMVFVFPYPHKAGLVSMGIAGEQIPQEAHAALDAIFMKAAADLATLDSTWVKFMIGHVNVAGSVASTGQPQIGKEIELSAATLSRLGPIYKGLNHIHRHQVVSDAVYAGSFCRMDYGENEPKGFIEIEFQKDGDEWEHRWGFRELLVPRQISIEGTLGADGFIASMIDDVAFETAEQVFGFTQADMDGADVRVKYHYRKVDAGVIDLDHIRQWVGIPRSLKTEPMPIIERDIRAPEVAAAKTLDEKAQAFCRLNGIAWTEGLADKLTALQAKDGIAVLAEVMEALGPQEDVVKK